VDADEELSLRFVAICPRRYSSTKGIILPRVDDLDVLEVLPDDFPSLSAIPSVMSFSRVPRRDGAGVITPCPASRTIT